MSPQSNHWIVIAIITAMWIALFIAVGAYVEHWASAKVGNNKHVQGELSTHGQLG
jgi:hypothetical protein